MNRVFFLYFGMFAVFIAAMWVILRIGSDDLVAPRDLNGQWRQQDRGSRRFTIHQSGEFVELALEDGPEINLVLTQGAHDSSNSIPIRMEGHGWDISVDHLEPGAAQFTFRPADPMLQRWAGARWYQRTDRRSAQGEELSAESPSPINLAPTTNAVR